MGRICGSCGSAVPEEAKFCTECGGSEFELQQDAGVFSPSVSDGSAALDSSLPEGAKTSAQQTYGQQQVAGGPSGDALGMTPHPSSPSAMPPSPQGEGFGAPARPYGQQNDNAAFGGYTSSDANAGYATSPYTGEAADAQQTYVGGGYSAPAGKRFSEKTVITAVSVVLTLVFTAVALFGWPGFLNNTKEPSLEGSWFNDYGDEIVIGADTLVGADGGTYSLKIEGDTLTVFIPDSEYTDVYRFELEGDTLCLYDAESGELDAALTRERVTRSDSVPVSLVGRWSDGGSEYIIFKSDLTGEYNNMEFDFTVSGDGVTLVGAKFGTVAYSFNVEGDVLSLYKDGKLADVMYRDGEWSLASCAVDPRAVGVWEDEDGDILTVYADGGATYVDDALFTVSASDGVMVWRDGEDVGTYGYAISADGGVMTITDYEYDEEYVFSRVEE